MIHYFLKKILAGDINSLNLLVCLGGKATNQVTYNKGTGMMVHVNSDKFGQALQT